MGAHFGEARAGEVALRSAVRLEGLALPDLEPIAQADHAHPIGQTEGLADQVRKRDPTSSVEGELHHAAQDRRLERRTQRIAERQLLDHSIVAIKQGLAAALDAVRLNRGEAENAIKGSGYCGAEFLRHHDAPLQVQLFLESREKHLGQQPPAIATGPGRASTRRFG